MCRMLKERAIEAIYHFVICKDICEVNQFVQCIMKIVFVNNETANRELQMIK